MTEKKPHILLQDIKQPTSYTPKTGGTAAEPEQPHFDQAEHGAELERAYWTALQQARAQLEALGVDPERGDQGAVVEMQFRPGTKVDVTSLENFQSRQHIEVLNVRLDEAGDPVSAVLYIPVGRENVIPRQINDYANPRKNKKGDRPSHYKKYDRTLDVVPAGLRQLWFDQTPLPNNEEVARWEVWLRAGSFQNFAQIVASLDVTSVSAHTISFPERQICAVECSLETLGRLELITKALTGFRYLRQGGRFFESLAPADQIDWQNDLASRVSISADTRTAVCLLDTGLRSSHPLLESAIAQNGLDSFHPDWGTDDHEGHGTEMAGIALFGDLASVLVGTGAVEIGHVLQSVKIFPPTGQNEDELVGYIAAQAVAAAEINRPDLRRVFCLSWAIGNENQKDGVAVTRGRPTPLSAQIDQLAFGVEESDDWRIDDDSKRLLLVAGGNIDPYDPSQYPDANDLHEIEDPGQAWNALTVGAMTDKVFTEDSSYDGWSAVAGVGQLSPCSRTSVLWGESYWPTKPDVVMEGGNSLAKDDYMEPNADTSLLTTGRDHIFCSVGDTSAANAGVARLAAMVSREYPQLWPEAVRGLMVHGASWTPGMLNGIDISTLSKAQKIAFLRRYGYGVPQVDSLLASSSNKPCIVIQDTVRPFAESPTGNSSVVFGEMNFYELPWPREQLEDIYDEEVRLRITLSYFVEPNPSERPPTTKYGYASHQLRFRLNRPMENREAFLARINKELAKSEDSEPEGEADLGGAVGDTDRWTLRPQTRDRGSVISDIWRGTGAELAGQNMLAVVPQQGWWKYRKAFPAADVPRYKQTVRYALIITLIAETEIDLYTPIVSQIEVQTPIEV